MIMGDLFCGRGGWTKGFQAHGWDCWGIDLFPQPDYPGRFIQADIAHLIELPYADFYCCSSPCEQFSVHGMKHFHPNPKWPWLGIALFNRAKELLDATGKPYVMENVRAAQKFIGKNDYQFGPFALWGNCFASMWPWPAYELTRLNKGFDIGGNRITRDMPIEERRKIRASLGSIYNTSSGSAARAKATSKAARNTSSAFLSHRTNGRSNRMTQNADTSQEKSAREPRIAKVKGRAVCPKGHRAPRVQYLASEELYCCTTCAITWKAIFEVNIPAEMPADKWARMAMAAPELVALLLESRESIGGDWRERRDAILQKAGVLR